MDAVTDTMPLVDWLASRSAEQLAAILELRPDAVWGAPLRGLDDLAARLSQPASVGIAVTQLPLPAFELLHALAALGPSPTITAAAALLHAANRTPDAQRDAVRGALARLSDWALAWEVDGENDLGHCRGGAGDRPAAGPGPHRSAAISSTVRSTSCADCCATSACPTRSRRDEVCTMLCWVPDRPGAGPQARAIRATPGPAPDHRTWPRRIRRRGNYLPKDQQQREGDNWARRRGLLFGGDYFSAEMPVEIVLAVRAGDIVVRFEPDPPSPDDPSADRGGDRVRRRRRRRGVHRNRCRGAGLDRPITTARTEGGRHRHPRDHPDRQGHRFG